MKSYAQERYEDLCEYFGDAKDILKSRKDFKAWLERIKWHVHKAEELYEKYEYKQEPCEDTVSRQEVLEIFGYVMDYWKENAINVEPHEIKDALIEQYEFTAKQLRDLPPVRLQKQTGYWIDDAKTYYEELNKRGLRVDEYTPYFTDDIACSECLAKYSMLDNETQFFKHCPNCGAKMVEPQEKSDKV